VLPPDPAQERLRAVFVLIEQGLAAGQNWQDISNDLNARGLKPTRSEVFNPAQTRALYRLWRGKSPTVSVGTQPSGSAPGIT
jgi:hypothetical protein